MPERQDAADAQLKEWKRTAQWRPRVTKATNGKYWIRLKVQTKRATKPVEITSAHELWTGDHYFDTEDKAWLNARAFRSWVEEGLYSRVLSKDERERREQVQHFTPTKVAGVMATDIEQRREQSKRKREERLRCRRKEREKRRRSETSAEGAEAHAETCRAFVRILEEVRTGGVHDAFTVLMRT